MTLTVAVLATFIPALLLRLIPFGLGTKTSGADHWFWLSYVEAYKKSKKFPPELPQYILDEAQWYPPVFPLLLCRFPNLLLSSYSRIFPIFIDMLRLFFLLFICYAITGNSFLAAAWAGAFYATSPILVKYNTQLNPRGLGALLLDIFLCIFIWWRVSAGPDWLVVFLLVLSGFILLTHKMATQLFWFLVIAVGLATRNFYLFMFIPGSVLMALLLSGGFYWKVALAHWDIVTFWNRNWRWLMAHPVRESPIYGEPGYETPTKFHKRGVNGIVRHFFFLIGTHPGAWYVAILAIFVIGKNNPVELYILLWTLFILLFALATVYVPVLKCLGSGYYYLYNAVFPCALLVGAIAREYPGASLAQAGFFVALLANLAVVVEFYLRTARDSGNADKLEIALSYLKEQQDGVIMCVPPIIYDSVAYHTHKPVLSGAHGYGLKKLEPTFPRLLIPLKQIIKSYNIGYLLIGNADATEKFLSDIVPQKVFKSEAFTVYHVDPETA